MAGWGPRTIRVVGPSAVAAAIGAAAVGFAYWSERAAMRSGRDRIVPAPPGSGPAWLPVRVPAIVTPTVATAEASGLGDDEAVLGVVVGGRARAYRLGAFLDRSRHVVNDVVGDVPVTVSYCDITDCVRVHTGPPGAGPLDMIVAGLYGGELAVETRGVKYLQKSGRAIDDPAAATIPHGVLTPERTTWGRWKARHPGTAIYVGTPPVGREAPEITPPG